MTAVKGQIPGSPRIMRSRSRVRTVVSIAVVALIVLFIYVALASGIIDPNVFLKYLFSLPVLEGVVNAIVLGTLALVLASVVGLIAAVVRLGDNKAFRLLSAAYVYLFRGTPMLIQLIFWFNALPAIFPRIHITVPGGGATLVDMPTISIVTPFVAALVGLALAEGAYMAEIIRSGILAVNKGQRAAAQALGMTKLQVFWRIVLPQAGRIILPTAGNQYIMLLKSTSLASIIGYLELLRAVTDVYSANFRVVELLAVAAVWYLAMTAYATGLQTFLERRYPQR